MALTRLRPSPSPRCERLLSPRYKRSQIFESSSGGMPMPVSVTVMTTWWSEDAATSTLPPLGVYLMALSRRLAFILSRLHGGIWQPVGGPTLWHLQYEPPPAAAGCGHGAAGDIHSASLAP